MSLADPTRARTHVQRHLVTGWWTLLVFLLGGLLLESLHAFKIDWYLGGAFEPRRLLWRLAHAHGTLLAVLNLAFAFTAERTRGAAPELASRLLLAATVLLPLGFFAGGVVLLEGDPSPAILLAPIGALSLVGAVFLTARATAAAWRSEPAE